MTDRTEAQGEQGQVEARPTLGGVLGVDGFARPRPPFYSGISVYEIHAPLPTFTYQIKRHKKRRIDKKWRKRYGFRTVTDRKSDNVMMVGNKAYCYPHVYKQLMASLRESNSPKFPMFGEKTD